MIGFGVTTGATDHNIVQVTTGVRGTLGLGSCLERRDTTTIGGQSDPADKKLLSLLGVLSATHG
jgi:hypothetical protein